MTIDRRVWPKLALDTEKPNIESERQDKKSETRFNRSTMIVGSFVRNNDEGKNRCDFEVGTGVVGVTFLP